MSEQLNLNSVSSEAMPPGNPHQYLIFAVEGAEYAVDIMTVVEIKGWTETTRLPNAPEFMRGVINLRGIIIPIFDLRARFRQGITEANAKHVVIILTIGTRNIGILVDAVSDILTVLPGEVKESPDFDSPANADYIQGLISRDNRMVVLLAVNRIFGSDSISLPQIDHF